jgi:hypothetical protein
MNLASTVKQPRPGASGRAGATRSPRPASEPILVLNCGSSSIKFALFDAAVTPLPRQPIWAGQVEGIGGKSPKLVQAGSPPTALVLDARSPTTPRCSTCARPSSRRPADGRPRRSCTGSCTAAASTPRPSAWTTTSSRI